MNSDIDEHLDHVDEWKFKLHDELNGLTAAQRRAFWSRIRDDAGVEGLRVREAKKRSKGPKKRASPRVRGAV